MTSGALPNESFREWLDRVNNRRRKPSPGRNGQQVARENSHQRGEWVLSPASTEHMACASRPQNDTGNLTDVGQTATNALQRQNSDAHVPANGISCPSVRSSTHSSVTSPENSNRKVAVNCEKVYLVNSTVDRGGNSLSIRPLSNATGVENRIESNSIELNAVQSGALNETVNLNANNDQDDNGLLVGVGNAIGPHAEDIDPNVPAWASATPVDGYIMHPVAGLVMHPSFYDNRHLIKLATQPRYIYDGEVDGPLCPIGKKCDHVKNCFEVRVRMAVLAYQRHHISFRDAEYIWSVSRSTIQRRKAALEKHSPLIFLLTPENTVE